MCEIIYFSLLASLPALCEMMFCINLPSCMYQLAHIRGKLIQFKKNYFLRLFSNMIIIFLTVYMVIREGYVMPTESAIRCYYLLFIMKNVSTLPTLPYINIIITVYNNNNNKRYTGLTVDSYLLPTSKSRDTKTRTKIKITTRQVLGIAP